jgi:DNA-binding transcriptional LysR family regulator
VRIDFLGLEAFLSIATWGSFHRAAASLNLSQTALSHRLKKLEDDLGVKLIARSTRQVSLTPSGHRLLPIAQKVIEELRDSFDALRGQGNNSQGHVAIGCLPTLAMHHLPVILAEFRKQYPSLSVRIFDNSVGELSDKVLKGEAAFAITILLMANSSDLEIMPLFKEPFVLACPADHPLTKQQVVEWPMLAGHPLIRISTQTGNRLLIDDALGSRRETMSWRNEVQHVATAIAMVTAGIGVAVVPKLGMAVHGLPGVVAMPLRNPSISRTLGIIAKRNETLSPPADDLLRLTQSHFQRISKADPLEAAHLLH